MIEVFITILETSGTFVANKLVTGFSRLADFKVTVLTPFKSSPTSENAFLSSFKATFKITF